MQTRGGGYKFGQSTGLGGNFNAVITALNQENLATILAEPTLTAMSGETASFSRVASIQFRCHKVFRSSPSTINASVSAWISRRRCWTTIGSTSKFAGGQSTHDRRPDHVGRRLSPRPHGTTGRTTVELASGESFAIAGLLQNGVRTRSRDCRGWWICRYSAHCSAQRLSSAMKASWSSLSRPTSFGLLPGPATCIYRPRGCGGRVTSSGFYRAGSQRRPHRRVPPRPGQQPSRGCAVPPDSCWSDNDSHATPNFATGGRTARYQHDAHHGGLRQQSAIAAIAGSNHLASLPVLVGVSTDRASNANSLHLGCVSADNLRAMVANPADLQRGRPLGPADADRVSQAFEVYQQGKIKPLAGSGSMNLQSSQ